MDINTLYMYTNTYMYIDMYMYISRYSFITDSSLRQRSTTQPSLGEAMYEAHKLGDSMPEAVEFCDDDTAKLEDMKNLILHMTSYEPRDRPTAMDVYHQTSAIYKRRERTRVRLETT